VKSTSANGRTQLRKRNLRGAALIAGVLVLLALLFLLGGHLVVGAFFGAIAAVAVLVLVQMRAVH
jgi:hypothetical protein